MLTGEAYRDRRWGWLPALRKVLERKPESFDGRFLSTDESEAEGLTKVLVAAALADHYQDEIREAARRGDMREFHEDIEHLSSVLRAIADRFKQAAERTWELHRYIDKPESAAQDEVRGTNA
jgi:hypothetical protein